MIFYLLTALLLSNANGKNLMDVPETPTFRWASSSRSSDGIYDLIVSFSDGTQDSIELYHYNPVELDENSEATTFMGHLKGDKNSIVAVTGIPHGSDYHVSIFRANHKDITVRVNKSGKSTHIERLLGEQLDIIAPTFEPLTQQYPIDRALPAVNYLRLVAGYTSSAISFTNGVAGFQTWLAQFMTHMQAYYQHPSLNFTVIFDTPIPVVDLQRNTSITRANSTNIHSVRSLTLPVLSRNGNGQHLSVYVRDDSGDGALGIAYMYGICSQSDLAVSITEIRESVLESAKVSTHELAHNFGVEHDKDPCKGIMYWNTAGGDSWSTCSNTGFASYQSEVQRSKGFWCLERSDPAGIGGSWTPWGPYSTCSKFCGGGTQTRLRTCVGTNCAGQSSITNSCNTQACPVCKDIDSDCASKKKNGWCAYNTNYMKSNCPQTCNVDGINSITCATYKNYGFCDSTSVNFVYMMYYCGLTCQYFCK